MMTAAATLARVERATAGGTTAAEPGRRYATVATELGELTLVADGAALVGVYFSEHRPEPDRSRFGEPARLADDPVLTVAAEQLTEYASGRRTALDLPLQATGSERARQVWDLVAAVPRGETITYAALGRAVGVGPRAAGQFVARNPLCVVVPCHRVVASDGRLTGYAGGVDRKRQLLQLEGALAPGATAVVPVPSPAAPAEAEG
jgi:methylated-DNA-[protein]-cysteine S-methyltransferase